MIFLFSALPVDKIPFTLFPNQETTITKNTLVTTIPVLPKLYEVSFDFKPTKWIGGWTSILHMTTGGNAGWGERIPAFFPLNKKIAIANGIDGNGNWYFWSPVLTLNKWVHFRLTQTFERHEYVYRVYMDKQLLKTKVNKKAQDFKQVDVWVGDNWYNAQPGVIKNLHISGSSLPTKPIFYKSLGCWKDTGNRAVPTLEGKDKRLSGSYSSRDYAIDLCYQSAKARGYHIFAVQNNGWCAGMRGTTRYQKYGKVTNCKNGKGGSWANDVYQIGELPVDKIPFTLFPNQETTIIKNTLVTTIPVLPKLYEVSFDFKPTKWIGGWTSILHMTTGGNAGWGERIPGFFPLNKKIAIANGIDGNGNWYFWSAVLTLNKWVHFRLTQTFERREYVYRVYMDKQLLKTKVNKKPQDFKQVDVWVGDN